MLYLFPGDPASEQRALVERDSGFRVHRYLSGQVEGDLNPRCELDPHTPMGIVMYRISLRPGERKSLDFKMPIVPIPEFSPESQLIAVAQYDSYYQKTVSQWTKLLAAFVNLIWPALIVSFGPP